MTFEISESANKEMEVCRSCRVNKVDDCDCRTRFSTQKERTTGANAL